MLPPGQFFPKAARRSLPGVDSLDCDRAEAVTAERLGASRWQVQAFRCAGFSCMLRWPVAERAAIDTI